jgi:ABC-2 type transport system permease protein
MVIQIVADSFAGERERHTLETLLATRLSERAILIGKIAASILYGFTLACAGIALSVLTVTFTAGQGRLLMFPPDILVPGIFTGLVSATTASMLGTLVSLRAASTRQAQQMLGFAMLFLFFLPTFLFYLLPEELVRSVTSSLGMHSPSVVILTVLAVLAVLDAVLFGAALARFKRQSMTSP